MKIFLDSSAFAKRYLEEQGSEKVIDVCINASAVAVSIICIPGMVSALARLKRESKLTKFQYNQIKESFFQDLSDVLVCNLTLPILHSSVQLLDLNNLRAMDALHVASALDWETELFVSADVRQLVAARKSGLEVLQV